MKTIIYSFLLFISFSTYSQNKLSFLPKLNVGIAYRLPAIEFGSKPVYPKLQTYQQNSNKFYHNLSVNTDITQTIINERILAQLSGYLRYGHKFYDKNNLGLSVYGENEKKVIKTDLFFDIRYLLNKKNENAWQFSIGAGYGWLNSGTKYKDSIAINNNQPNLKVEIVKSYKENAPRLLIGMQKDNYNLFLIIHGISAPQKTGNPTIWIETKFNYTIWKLKK
ncbi:MAG: hypothetical protein KA319_01630 [Ferruginibacter sp.]|nr:hypothetical protein [Ferruginibacter sp.]